MEKKSNGKSKNKNSRPENEGKKNVDESKKTGEGPECSACLVEETEAEQEGDLKVYKLKAETRKETAKSRSAVEEIEGKTSGRGGVQSGAITLTSDYQIGAIPKIGNSKGQTSDILAKKESTSEEVVSDQISAFGSCKFTPSPGPGSAGRKIDLTVNYYKLRCNLAKIYHYDVEIVDCSDKTSKSSRINRQRCQYLFAKFVEVIKDRKETAMFDPVYDGNKNFYTAVHLPMKDKINIAVSLPVEGKSKKFEIIVKPVKKRDGTNIINLQALQNWGRMDGSMDTLDECLLALNIIMNYRALKSGEGRIGRSFFSFNDKKNMSKLGQGLEIWQGYNQSVHITEKGPTVIVNLSAKVFLKKLPVIEYVNEVLCRDIRKSFEPLAPFEINKIERALKGVRIQVNHLSYKRKFYVKAVSTAPAKYFKIEVNERETTVAQYFKEKYNLQFPYLHCLQMRTNNNKTFIPFEKCEVLEGQPKVLNEDSRSKQVTSEVIKVSAVQPRERFAKIQECVNATRNEHIKKFNLFMELNPLKIQGRVITPPVMKSDSKSITVHNGRWAIEGKLSRGIKNESWIILHFTDENSCSKEVLKHFAAKLDNTSRSLGLRLGEFKGVLSYGKRVSSEQALQINEVRETSLIIIVLSKRDNYHNYDEIKFIADFRLQLITQCIMEDVILDLTPTSLLNICLKINAKLGGVSHEFVTKPKVFGRPVIVIGADVVHSTFCPSIAAVVGSLDAIPSKYKVSCRVQENEKRGRKSQELILELQEMVTTILKAFKENCGGKEPEKIIFFRDGVSEGQFGAVRNHEVPAIQKASKQLLDRIIPVTFIVVQKRHQTRIRPENQSDGIGAAGNIPPGITVDTDITYPNAFDYFLCSHEGIRGTSKPARYTVLHDDNAFTADELQELSFHMCHLYARCTKSVSIPAPVKYADLAAYRAKKYADFHLKKMKMENRGANYSSSSDLPEHARVAINKMEDCKNHLFFV